MRWRRLTHDWRFLWSAFQVSGRGFQDVAQNYNPTASQFRRSISGLFLLRLNISLSYQTRLALLQPLRKLRQVWQLTKSTMSQFEIHVTPIVHANLKYFDRNSEQDYLKSLKWMFTQSCASARKWIFFVKIPSSTVIRLKWAETLRTCFGSNTQKI